jgi:hypothetical protein
VSLFSMWLGFFAGPRLVLGGGMRVSQVQLLQPPSPAVGGADPGRRSDQPPSVLHWP